MSEFESKQSYGQSTPRWGRAKSEPKFIDIGSGRIESILTRQQFKQGPYGKWVPISRRDLDQRAAE